MRLCKGFFDLSPDQIEYILLQARPYDWVEFKNVSLRPEYKTDVQVEVKGAKWARVTTSGGKVGVVGSVDGPAVVVRKVPHPEGTSFFKKFDQHYLLEIVSKSFGQDITETIGRESSGGSSGPGYIQKRIGFGIPFSVKGVDGLRKMRQFRRGLSETIKEDIKETLGVVSGGGWTNDLIHFTYRAESIIGTINIFFSDKDEDTRQIYFVIQEVTTPKDKTDVQVEIEPEKPAGQVQGEGGAPKQLSSGGGYQNLSREQRERLERLRANRQSLSYKNMQKLGLAVAVFANDHKGRCPSNLSDLRKYIADEKIFDWINRNVVYLGKNQQYGAPPDAVLAYDESMLKKPRKETNVLYNDAHVSLEKSQWLKEQGIIVEQKPAGVGLNEKSINSDSKVKVGGIVQDEGKERGKKNGYKWISHFAETNKSPGAERQIVIEARVFSIKTPNTSIPNYLYSKLGIKNVNTETPLMMPVQLTNEQADKFEKWAAAIPGTTTLVSPKVTAVNGELVDLSLTTQHERIMSYKKPEDSSGKPEPVFEKFTTGVKLGITPELQRDGKAIVLKLAFSKNDLVRVKKDLNESGYEIELPVLNTVAVNTNVLVASGKNTLVPVAGLFSTGKIEAGGKPIQQTLLLVKTTILNLASGLHDKPDVQVGVETAEGKTDVGMNGAEAIEKVSSFIACDLPKSAKDVKFYSEGFMGIGIVLIKFDIPLPDLKALLKKSEKLPDFAALKKDLQIQKRIEDYKTSNAEWWEPDELKDAVYGGWTKSEKASQDPNNRVWFVRSLQICSAEIKSRLMRVYIGYYDGD